MRRRMLIAGILVALALVAVWGLAGCGEVRDTAATNADTTAVSSASTTATVPPGSASTTPPTSAPASDSPALEPITVPTLPADIPSYTDVDPATGLHMTGTPQVIDLAGYRLKVFGKVDRELSLTYDEIRVLPKVTARPNLVCPGFFQDTATWSGAPIEAVLEMSGVQPDAQRIILRSADGYGTTISLEDARDPANFLAYELEGEPVPVLHGFPLRAVFPEKYGSYWVKWLVEIEVE